MPTVLKVKRLDEKAKLPCKAHETDACFDLYALDGGKIKQAANRIEYIEYRTGLSIEPPDGYHVEIFPRSSISKTDLNLANCVPIIDQGYRGEILLRFRLLSKDLRADGITLTEDKDAQNILSPFFNIYHAGDRIAQMMLKKSHMVIIEEVEELSDTARNSGGFGSTGR